MEERNLIDLRNETIVRMYDELSLVAPGTKEYTALVDAIDKLQTQADEREVKIQDLINKDWDNNRQRDLEADEAKSKRKEFWINLAERAVEFIITTAVTAVGWLMIRGMHQDSITADSYGVIQRSASFKLIPGHPDRV